MNQFQYAKVLRARRRAKRRELIQRHVHAIREHRLVFALAKLFPRLQSSAARRIGIPLKDLKCLIHRITDIDAEPKIEYMPHIR